MTAPRHARSGVRKRFKALTSSLATLSLVAAGAVGLSTSASAADLPQDFLTCDRLSPGEAPTGVANDIIPTVYDGITSYIGGSFDLGEGIAEVEGLTVVNGNLHLARQTEFGKAVGSEIRPGDGKDVLLVGGNVSGTGSINSGSESYRVRVGQTLEVSSSLQTDQNLGLEAALTTANYSPSLNFADGFDSQLTNLSHALGQIETVGTASLDSENALQLDGSNTANDVVRFDISADDLNAAAKVSLANVGSTQPIVINVVGSVDVSRGALPFEATYTDLPGDYFLTNSPQGTYPGDFLSQGYPWNLNVARALGFSRNVLWNFENATNISLNGSDQWVGSIVAPAANAELNTSLNGQFLFGGDVSYGNGEGSGFEIHAFPWTGCVTPADVDPEPEKVTVRVTKRVEGDKPPADTEYTFDIGTDGSRQSHTFKDGETIVVDSFPLEGTVGITEITPDVEGFTFEGVEFSGVEGGTDGNSFEFELNGEDVEIIVTNTFSETPEPEVPGVVPVTGSVNVEGDCVAPSINEFSMTYQVEGEESVTVPFNADGSVDLPEFEAGTKVTFSTDVPDLEGIENGSVTINGSQQPVEVTIVEGGNPGLEVAFGYDCVQDPVTSDVAVNTEVKINGQCELPEDAKFTITYEIDGETHTKTVDPNGSFTIDDLPAGTEVTFIADAPEFEGLENGKVVINNGNNTITVGEETTTINIAYEYDCQETPEPVEVEQVVVDLTIEEATCELPDGAGFVVEYSYKDADGQTVTGSETLTAGDTSFTVEDVPVGTEVTFTVTAPAAVDGVLTVDGNTDGQTVVTVTEGGNTVTISFAQECAPEPVEVEQVVVDLTIEEATCELPDGAGFVVEYSYVDSDGQTVTGSETLTAGDKSFTVEDVPVGTEVTFTVAAPSDVDGVLTVDGNTSDQTVVMVTEGGNTVEISFAQECAPEPEVPGVGGVKVSTSVDVNGVCELPGNIEVTVTYTVDGEEQTWTGSAGDSFTLDELDEDTEVVITSITTNSDEIVDGEAIITVDGHPVDGPATVTADEVREIGIALSYDCVEDEEVVDPDPEDPITPDEDDEDETDKDETQNKPDGTPEDEADTGTGGDAAALPRTGSESLLLGLGAIVLLAAGGALILVTRRKANQN